MNKRTLRAFALGILFTTIILVASPYLLKEESPLELEQAKTFLEEQGYKVMTKDEFEKVTAKTDKEENIEEQNNKNSDIEKKNPAVVEKDEDAEPEETTPESAMTYELVIKSGMDTGAVSQLLVEAKIIEDKARFEEYLIDHGYNTKLQIGTFELNNKMDYKEISQIITRTAK